MNKEISELEKLIQKKVSLSKTPLKYEIINEEKGQYKLTDETGSEFWYQKDGESIDKLHREDGPAVIFKQAMIGKLQMQHAREEWYQFGKLHRKAGPAITSILGQEWFLNGKRHREDGPAYDGGLLKGWFINGEEVSPQNTVSAKEVKENVEKIRNKNAGDKKEDKLSM